MVTIWLIKILDTLEMLLDHSYLRPYLNSIQLSEGSSGTICLQEPENRPKIKHVLMIQLACKFSYLAPRCTIHPYKLECRRYPLPRPY
jgi:hypothetical protein